MTESQRYAALRQILPFAHGNTVDELLEFQLSRMLAAQQEQPMNPSLSTAGATTSASAHSGTP